MSDVSCKVIRTLADFIEFRKAGDRERLFVEIRHADPADRFLDRAYLMNPRHRIPWTSFCTVSTVLSRYMGDVETRDAFFDYTLNRDNSWVPFVKLFSLLTNVTHLYWISHHISASSVFGVIEPSIEKMTDGRLRSIASIPEPLPPNQWFFEMVACAMKRLPNFIGLPNATVEVRCSEREAMLLIQPPAQDKLRTRLWRYMKRVLSTLTAPISVMLTMSEQDRELRKSHLQLQRAEAELSELRRQLDSPHRNAEKTQEALLPPDSRHELNNALHGLFLSLDATERALATPSEASQKARQALGNARRFAEACQALLKPAPERPADSTEPAPEEWPPLDGGTEHILVIDDEPELLLVMKDTLSAFGYQVSTATDADEALEVFSKQKIDLILTDQNMPTMTGLELAQRFRELRPETPVLLCTGYQEVELGANIASCISKPLDGHTLNSAIRSALQSAPLGEGSRS